MDPITILALGGMAVLALSKRKPPAPPPPTTALAKPPEPSLLDTVGKYGPGAVGVIGTGASALGLTAAGVLPFLGPIALAGGAGYAGDKIGEKLDQLLGGDGKGITGGILRAGLATAGMSAVLGCFFGVAATTLSATGIGLLALAAVWLVASAISDLDRLHFGQNGAWLELQKEVVKAKSDIADRLRAAAEMSAAQRGRARDPEWMVQRAAWAMAEGYIDTWNYLRYETWMRRGFGLGQNRAYHAKFGMERGYFVGEVDPDNGNLLPRQGDWYASAWSRTNWPGVVNPTPDPSSYQGVLAQLPADQQLVETYDLTTSQLVAQPTPATAKGLAIAIKTQKR